MIMIWGCLGIVGGCFVIFCLADLFDVVNALGLA